MSRTIIDQIGNEINIPAPSSLRIISLVPSQTEYLFDLGLDEEVVGITKFCVHPRAWFKSKSKIGGTKSYKFDQINALKPTLIIGNKEENDKEGIAQLAKDYPIYVSDVKNLEDALIMMKNVAQLVDRQQEGKKVIKTVKTAFLQLAEKNKAKYPKRTAYFIWKEPLMTVGGDTFINELMEKAGFINVFKHQNRYPITNFESLKEMDIEQILLSSEPFPFKEKHVQEFRQLLPHANVKLVDGEYFSWYGSRMCAAPAYFLRLNN